MEKLVDEAEANLHQARDSKQMGSANGALELIGRVTGLLSGRPQESQVPITRITINLAPGVVPPDQPQVIELPAGEFGDIPEGDES